MPLTKPLDSTTVTSNYSIALTKKIREKINANIGDLVLFFERDGEIFIRTAVDVTSSSEKDTTDQ